MTSASIPAAFRSVVSGEMMTDPGLADCSHLFDRTDLPVDCPSCGTWVSEAQWLELPTLLTKIQAHTPPQPRSYAQAAESASSAPAVATTSAAPEPAEAVGGMLWRVPQAHGDDIHAITMLEGEQRFITGGKDGVLKIWERREAGSPEVVREIGRDVKGYQFWVTATAMCEGGFYTGTRDGYVTRFDSDGELLYELEYTPPDRADQVSKQRNKHRIHCLSTTPHGTFFGTTRYFHELSGSEQGNYTRVHKNDWIYCIEPIADNLLVVCGDALKLYAPPQRRRYWSFEDDVFRSPPKEGRSNGSRRAQISALTRLNDGLFGMVDFWGYATLIDAKRLDQVARFKAHLPTNSGDARAWSIRPLSEQIYATSGEDHAVCFWDVRESKPVMVFDEHPGRVSGLLRLSETCVVTTSCHKDPHRDPDQGVLTCWDMRKG